MPLQPCNGKLSVAQEEFHFYLEDARSRLLLVPAKGNAKAEQAASQLRVPVASLGLTNGRGASVSAACTALIHCPYSGELPHDLVVQT